MSNLDHAYCPLCRTPGPAVFRPGPAKRPDASCPSCGSLERHRFLAILLECLHLFHGRVGTVLDIAPSKQVTPLLERLEPKQLVRLDLGADNRLVDVLASLTALPLRDDSVDLTICYHVLEHVPDDRTAMRELRRVLAPGGVALLQVPYRAGTITDEDPGASPEERLRRFGQADHVRYYGDDFEDRLLQAGLAFERVSPAMMVGLDACIWMKLRPDETVWLATPDEHPTKPPAVDLGRSALGAAFDTLLDKYSEAVRQSSLAGKRVNAAEARTAHAEERIRELKAAVRQLKRPRSVRAAVKELTRATRTSMGWRLRRIRARR